MDQQMRPFRDEVKDIILSILRTMLTNESDVNVTYTAGSRTTVYKVECHPDDYGVLLGKNGRNIEGLRRVTMAMTTRFGSRGIIELPDIPKDEFFND
ncbi:hypothetical protein AZI85_04100 [Bdellovibrio bacteriovorus]|uniref:Uncharacterized protein n=1 Tax=Bdellovibrio bacteriovorus TaxID=959 RepID=A0A150WKU8_BDEBC|nr:KH domain-containing protein [Bdellovibrio bacteriovorus]KYG64600.1 hypothetical protein AZI85_04100 [Bdellovibrio bacteriovorus]